MCPAAPSLSDIVSYAGNAVTGLCIFYYLGKQCLHRCKRKPQTDGHESDLELANSAAAIG